MFDFRRVFGVCVAIVMLAGCGGSQPMTGAPSTGIQPSTRSPQKAIKGYFHERRPFCQDRRGGPWLFSRPCRNLRPTSIRTRVSLFLARCTLRSIMQVGAAIYISI